MRAAPVISIGAALLAGGRAGPRGKRPAVHRHDVGFALFSRDAPDLHFPFGWIISFFFFFFFVLKNSNFFSFGGLKVSHVRFFFI